MIDLLFLFKVEKLIIQARDGKADRSKKHLGLHYLFKKLSFVSNGKIQRNVLGTLALHEKFLYLYSGPSFPAFSLNMSVHHYRGLSISPYSVRMLENTDQKNSEYEHFLCSVIFVSNE